MLKSAFKGILIYNMKKLKLLVSYAKDEWFIYFLAFIFTVLSQIAVAFHPKLIKITIDSVLNGKPLDHDIVSRAVSVFGTDLHGFTGLVIMAGFVVLFSAVRNLFTFTRINLASVATENSIKKLRNRLYNHIQLLPYAYHAKTETGDLIQRCTSDIETIRLALYSQIMDTISAIFLIVYSLVLMAQINLHLTFISFAAMPMLFLFSMVFFYKIQKQFKTATEYEAAMTTAIQENLTGIRVVKAFTRHNYEIEKFTKLSESYRNQNLKINNSFAVFFAVSDSIAIAYILLIIIYGGILAYRNEITSGNLVAFISYVGMLIWPIRRLGRIIGNIGKSFVSAERINTILTEPAEQLFPSGKKPEIKGSIVFDSVSFLYPKTENNIVLKDVSFEIKSGQTLAILGATGSGKTSLIQLLTRLYEYSSGSIKIDGIELNTIDKGWIRSQIGLVLQEPFLYGKTIMENLKLANPSISDETAKHYAETAELHNEIMKFEKGYDTIVGERGVSLSGGQKQRLAIARTLIKNSPVLIFDDSLSAVDTQTDMKIRHALEREKGSKTIIIISHRISTICNADKIIVLENGMITQQGKHSELIVKDGLYKRIYEIQNGNFEIETL